MSRKTKLHFLLIAVMISFPSIGFAGTYWVSPTGTASWSSCTGSTPLSGGSACSLPTANANAAADDVVYLRGGTYSVSGSYVGGITPSKNGTSGHMIAFVAAVGETPIITQAGGSNVYGLHLSGNSYIKIDGITFQDLYSWGYLIDSSHHIEIVRCIFTSTVATDYTGSGLQIFGDVCGSHDCWVTHVWIHDSTFSKLHNRGGSAYGTDCTDDGVDLLKIGAGCCSLNANASENNYFTIENNLFEYNSHASLDAYGRYGVIRNNVFHNEPWLSGCTWATPNYTATYTNAAYNGKYSHRNFQVSEDYLRDGNFILVEGNRTGHAGVNPTNGVGDNFDLAAPKNIVRYNYSYGATNDGLTFKYADATVKGSGGTGSKNNRVYNNTIYRSGYGYAGPLGNEHKQGVVVYISSNPGIVTGNIFKNNIVYDSNLGDFGCTSGGCVVSTNISIVNNWCTSAATGCTRSGNPLFSNTDLTTPTSRTLPTLALQSNSAAIDGGTYLTQANGSGSNSKTLVVNDALYFQDGTWGAEIARGVTFFPDWIAIGTVNNVVQISSINYSTNTITLASAMTWSNGAKIWLYSKSDGTRVLYGCAPDYGAYEVTVSDSLCPPGNARIVQ